MSGSPRSSTTRSGRWRAASCSAISPVPAASTVVAARAAGSSTSARRICGSSSTTRTQSRHRSSYPTGQRDDGGGAAAGRVVELELTVHRVDETAGHGQAEPDAAVAVDASPSRWNGRKTRSRSAARMPGPRSTTRRCTRSCTAPASTRTGASGGDHLSAFSTRFAITRSSNAASPLHRRERLGDVASRRARARSPRLASAAGTTSSRCTSRTIGFDHAGLQAAHVEQVADERVEPIGFVLDRREELGDVGRDSTPRRVGAGSTRPP